MIFQDIMNYIKLPFRKEKELYYSLRPIIGFYPAISNTTNRP